MTRYTLLAREEEMWGLVNTISRATRRCIMLHRLHPALMEFTRLTNWNPAECLCHKPTVPHSQPQSDVCACSAVSLPSSETAATGWGWEEEGTGRTAQLCHLAGALLQNRLFLHCCALLTAQLLGPIKKHHGCSDCIFLLFYLTIFLQCFALDLEACEIVFCLLHPSN